MRGYLLLYHVRDMANRVVARFRRYAVSEK